MSTRRRDGRSKKRPGLEAQRQVVVEVAVRLFVAHGTSAVSISQICTAADLSRPTFYRCFPDKAALVSHIYDVAVRDHMQVNLAAVLREDGGQNDIRTALDVMVDRIFERPDIAAFLFAESSDEHSPAHTIVQAAFDDASALIEARYVAHDRTAPPRLTLKATMVACQWLVHDAIRCGPTPQRMAAAKHAMWALVEAVFFERRPPLGLDNLNQRRPRPPVP